MASSSKTIPSIGFLSVCEHDGQGLFGGFLVLNMAGRPLEFHCTAPVRASRAQEILYGPTLKPYLYGEQIGRTLLEKVKVKPDLVFTDVEPALSLRAYSSCPVVLAQPVHHDEDENDAPNAGQSRRIDAAHAATPMPYSSQLRMFQVGSVGLAVHRDHEADIEPVSKRWQPLADEFDILEPFGRIREAIDEARRGAR